MIECSQGQEASSGNRQHFQSDRDAVLNLLPQRQTQLCSHDLKVGSAASASIMLHRPEQPVLEPPNISAGDLVIVYEGFNAMKAVQVEPTMNFGTKFGHFPMKVGLCLLRVPLQLRAPSEVLQMFSGLGGSPLWLQGHCQAGQEHCLAATAAAYARAVDPGAEAQNPDPVRGRHKPGVHAPRAAA